ncbi:MAG: DNA polymerase I [Actinomycetota bacterium]|nr:DNA polymerase I [Actinomycetota bacterium]
MSKIRLLLLDGHSLAYRAFYALPVENFATSTGQPTNAVYGFTSMLINLLRDERPTHVAVAFDVSRHTFRSEEFPAYKANRATSPPEFKGQVDLIQEVVRAMGIPAVQCEGFEADDVIATLTGRALTAGGEVFIVTGDRDAFALVTPEVTVLYPKKGVSDLARMTPDAVQERYGLSPAQYPDYAALRGDPSDNLPGIPGVGEKTAAKWINEYGSLAELIDHVAEVPGKAGVALRAALPQVIINRNLTALRANVPIDLEVAACELRPWNDAAIEQIFEALQFRTLRDRFFAGRPKSAKTKVESATGTGASAAATPVAAAVIAGPQAGEWLARLRPPCAVAFAGTWGRGVGVLAAVGIVDSTGTSAIIETSDQVPRLAVLKWLADPAIAKWAHDAKGPALAVASAGSTIKGLAFDTALAAYVVAPGQRSFVLADVAQRLLGRELLAESSSEQLSFDDVQSHAGLAEQAAVIGELSVALTQTLEKEDALKVLEGIELPLVDVLARMEHAGIAVDIAALADLTSEFGATMRAAETRAHEIVGRPFNLGSPKQLQEVLFTDRNLPKTKKIKTGYTTDAEALQSLYAQTNDPLIEQLLNWRDRSKLRQTVDGLLPLADGSQRIHTTFNQTTTATGRLSSTDPNLQNIPIRTEAGRRIRECFVVGAGYEGLLTADYSQIEMRIMAHASADAGLIDAFVSGEDLHTTVASRVFGVAPGAVDPEMRRRTKAMSYGLAYGLSAFGLSQQLGIGPQEAGALMNEYFTRFGGVRDYLAAVVEDARLTGYTQTMFGRRRYLPDLNSDNRQRREMAERMALNAPIQGTAADIVKLAMLAVDEALKAERMQSRMLLQVHDELVLEVCPGERAELEVLVRTAMAGATTLAVPLDVSIGFGASWAAAAH